MKNKIQILNFIGILFGNKEQKAVKVDKIAQSTGY